MTLRTSRSNLSRVFSRSLSRGLGVLVAAVALTAAAVLAPASAAVSATDAQRNGGPVRAAAAPAGLLVVGGGWQEFGFGEAGSTAAVLQLVAGSETWMRVTDTFCAGDQFAVLDNGAPLGSTSEPTASSCDVFTESLTRAEVGDAWSSGGWLLPAGRHTITIVVTKSPFLAGRGFLRADSPLVTARLRGSQEAPGPGDPDGMGASTMLLSAASQQVCYVMVVNRIDDVIAGHIHRGDPAVAGPIVVNLMLQPGPQRVRAGCVPADPAVLRAIAFAPWKYYTNVHTTVFPAGAIRGQLQPPRSR